MVENSLIRFQFSGGLADEGQLNFYEAGRFMYAASRLLYVLDKFRQEEKIVQRITKGMEVDMRISASKKGSFVQEIFILTPFILEAASQAAIQAPIQVLVAHFMDFFLRPFKAEDAASRIAEYNYKIEVERTKQSEQETTRLDLFSRVATGNQATMNEMLSMIKNANQGRIPIPDDLQKDKGSFNIYEREIEAAIRRKEEIDPFRDEIEKIPENKNRQMLGRVQRIIPDIGVPLRGSADALHISTGENEENKIIYLNERIVESISGDKIDDDETIFKGKIKSYDVETGHGKFRVKGSSTYIPFNVTSASKMNRTIQEIILDEVCAAFYVVRDATNTPKRLIFVRLLMEEDFAED